MTYTHIYIYILQYRKLEVESNWDIVPFVRACLQAKLHVPARRCCFRGWAIVRNLCSIASRRAPFPSVLFLAVASRRF